MAKQNTAPTMKDVAKEAGVSLGTVSKVINGIPVGEEYRKKVEQAIKELDNLILAASFLYKKLDRSIQLLEMSQV